MATTVDELLVKISADFSDLKKEFNQAKNQSKKTGEAINKNFKKAGGGIKSLIKKIGPLAAAMAAAVSVTKVFGAVWDTFQKNDALGKTARRLGLTTEALGGLHLAAQLGGLSVAQMDTSLKFLNRSLSEALEGTGPASDAFLKLGLNAEEMIKKTPDEAFAVIAEKINGMANQAEKTAAAMDIFGRSGADLVTVMDGGASAIESAIQKSKELGTSISEIDTQKAAIINDAFLLAGEAIDGLIQKLSAALGPAFLGVARSVETITKAMTESSNTTIGFGDVVLTMAAAVVQVVHGMVVAWEGVKLAVAVVRAAVATQMSVVVNIITDIVTRVQGMGEVISGIMEDPAGAFSAAWLGMKQLVMEVVAGMTKTFGDMVQTMGEKLGAINSTVGNRIKAVGQEIKLVGLDVEIAAAEAGNALDEMVSKSEGLQKVAGGLDKVFAAFDPTKAKDTGVAFIDGFADGLNERADEARDAVAEQLENVLSVANAFGGKTAFEFVSGMGTVLDEEAAALAEKTKNALGGPGGDDDKKTDLDPRVVREAAVLAEISKLEKARTDEEIKNEAQRQNFYKSSLNNKLSVTSSILGDLATLMDGKSKKMFKVGKAAALSQAIVDMWAGANKAMSTLPWPVNLVAAGATIAAGAINVQKIKSQQFGAGGGGGGGGGGASSAGAIGAGGEGDGGEGAAPQQNTTFNIGLQGQNFSGSQVRGLLNQMNDQLDDNATINVFDEVQ